MGKEHPGGVPVPYLQRVQIETVSPVHIQQQLGGIPDSRHRVKGVASPQQGEIGHRIQTEQIGTGHPEEISHHQVRVPDRLQGGKTVENVKGVPAFPGDPVINFYREGFKALIGIKGEDFQTLLGFKNRRMTGKPHVNQIAAVRDGLSCKGNGEKTEFLQILHLPDHVVAQPDGVQKPIHAGNTTFYSVKCAHGIPPVSETRKRRRGSEILRRLCRNLQDTCCPKSQRLAECPADNVNFSK